MKTITLMKSPIALRLVAALFLTATFTGSATAAQHPLPFRGFYEQVEDQVVVFPLLHLDIRAAGNATHLGNFTMTGKGTINLLTLSNVGPGASQFIAANGDKISTSVVGQATPTGVPDQLSIVEIHTITGGTGRFAGASGAFTVLRLLNTITDVSAATFEGTITLL
jgi:hypothetical protein